MMKSILQVPQIYDYLSIQGFNTKFGLTSTNFEIYRQGEIFSIINQGFSNQVSHLVFEKKRMVK